MSTKSPITDKAQFRGDILDRQFSVHYDPMTGQYSYDYAEVTPEILAQLNTLQFYRISSTNLADVEGEVSKLRKPTAGRPPAIRIPGRGGPDSPPPSPPGSPPPANNGLPRPAGVRRPMPYRGPIVGPPAPEAAPISPRAEAAPISPRAEGAAAPRMPGAENLEAGEGAASPRGAAAPRIPAAENLEAGEGAAAENLEAGEEAAAEPRGDEAVGGKRKTRKHKRVSKHKTRKH